MPDAPRTVYLPRFIDDRPIGRLQYTVLALCGLVMFLDGFDTQAISYMAPSIAREWGLSPSAMGPVFSSALVGLMIGYLVLSPLADRFGHRAMIITATASFSVLTVLTTFAPSVEILLAARLLTGIGLGAAAPSAIALTSEFAPRRRRATFVLVIYCGFSLGFVAAGAAAGTLMPVLGWRSLFLVGGIVPLALVPLLWRLLPESPAYLARRGRPAAQVLRRLDRSLPTDAVVHIAGQEDSGARIPLVRLFERRWLLGTLLLWLVFAINLAEFYALQSWLPTILDDLGHPTSTVVTATTLTTVGGIAAALITGPAMDRFGAGPTLGILYLVGAAFVGVLGVAFGASLWLLLCVTFMVGCCVSGGQKSVIAFASLFYPPDMRSTGVAWALGIGRIGGILGPIVVGFAVAADWSTAQLFGALAIPMLVAAVTVIALARRRYRDGPALGPESRRSRVAVQD
ncbi:MFS transporter [Pseudonocardia sp. MH-G8]|uniref:MFS transporter n=1 Tax=Pseudonocardia sp. MH-G8 TaxID=1854588 RepID=UPI000BA1081B|nr:MFS transporter [Pseudonocardia sp. MH-G8]OZM76075.1 MFS transporter [Pseudonocardia sp. MH-G8]